MAVRSLQSRGETEVIQIACLKVQRPKFLSGPDQSLALGIGSPIQGQGAGEQIEGLVTFSHRQIGHSGGKCTVLSAEADGHRRGLLRLHEKLAAGDGDDVAAPVAGEEGLALLVQLQTALPPLDGDAGARICGNQVALPEGELLLQGRGNTGALQLSGARHLDDNRGLGGIPGVKPALPEPDDNKSRQHNQHDDQRRDKICNLAFLRLHRSILLSAPLRLNYLRWDYSIQICLFQLGVWKKWGMTTKCQRS